MQETRTSPDRRGAALTLGVVTMLFWYSQYAITPYINKELARMGASAGFMGLVGGIYGLTQLLLRIPLGLLADRMGRHKPFIVMGCGLAALSSALLLLWYTPAGFLVLRGVAGMASASWVSFTILYAAYYEPIEGPRRISQLNILNQAGRLLCYITIGAAVARYALRASFVMGAAAGFLCFLLSLLVRDVPRPAQPVSLRRFRDAARDRNMMVTSLLGLLTQVVAFATFYGFSNNLALRIEATESQLSLLNLVLVASAILANVIATGFLPRMFHVKHIVAAGFLLGALYCVLAPLCRGMVPLYLCQVLAGLCSGFTFAMLLGHCVRDIPQEMRSAGMGFYQAVYGIGMTIGPLLMGVLIDALGLDLSFYFMAALALFTAGLTLKLLR
ncbi:MAG: MFS transporter [Christensenellales bacterium]